MQSLLYPWLLSIDWSFDTIPLASGEGEEGEGEGEDEGWAYGDGQGFSVRGLPLTVYNSIAPWKHGPEPPK